MINKDKFKKDLKKRRQARGRAKIFGTQIRPRLVVFRSLKGIYVQLINDETGTTLASASSREVKGRDLKKTDVAFKIGELIAAQGIKVGINQVIFDRAGYKYHGRVKAVGEGARKGGLKF